MQPNGTRRCPVCKEQPIHTEEMSSFSQQPVQQVGCPRNHGYIGRGETVEQATYLYNKLIDHYVAKTTYHTVLEESSKTSSPCPYCCKDTEGKTFSLPKKEYYVECVDCHLVKYEGKPL